jgi:hypothetical protein
MLAERLVHVPDYGTGFRVHNVLVVPAPDAIDDTSQ